MAKIVDYDKGILKQDIDTKDGVTVTVYSFKTVEARNYCRKHQGLLKEDCIIYEWHEDCNCVQDKFMPVDNKPSNVKIHKVK